MTTIERGAWSGILATGPMTIAMSRLYRELPPSEQSPLPPATLTSQALDRVGADVPSRFLPSLTMANHFAYGAACGIVYSSLPKRVKSQPVLTGTIFGLGVWCASYLGWTPMFGFRAAAPRMPIRRNVMMIAAHVVWGASLGLAEADLDSEGDRMLVGRRKAPHAE